MNTPVFSLDPKPISDYAVIGNLRTAALVGVDGSIDWCCLPHLDSPSVFGALLDPARAGRFGVAMERTQRRSQRYCEGTNVLATTFEGDGGRLVVTDFMPLAGELRGKGGQSATRPEILRRLAAQGDDVRVAVEWSPRFDYARGRTRIERAEGGAIAEHVDGTDRLSLVGLPADADVTVTDDGFGPVLRASFGLRGGAPVTLATRWDSDPRSASSALVTAEQDLSDTLAAWRRWLRQDEAVDRGWAGEWGGLVERSELVMKLLMHAESGALAAAVTTSLPETIGGVRNWDYRFSWIRDAALIGEALLAVGHRDEMVAFLEWSERVSDAQPPANLDNLRILYGLRPGEEVPEEQLDHLDGYRGSRPVRIGNAAVDQRQHDIYGELVGAAFELARVEALPPRVCRFVSSVATRALDEWREPDHGIWEMRCEKMHYVHSKVKVWEALDLATRLAARGLLTGPVERWRSGAREVREDILTRGFDRDLGAFVMAYERPVLDAANLSIPMHEFLPADDPRVQGTIDRTLERLTSNGLVYRYHTDDGLPGDEGAFGLTTFKMVDALALSKRREEAHRMFERMAGRANHVGLFSEQIDPTTGEFLGNFPQAFTHIGLISSALYLAHCDGKELPVDGLLGTEEHRRRKAAD